ncbi:hypothetical protein YA0002_18585 [Pseudomonas cichorii]|uniref:hypothetical protein n=1 Tax=Pseudomonas cichorii TaxID=36746 RepID=UPI0018E5FB10|nr:hypothetical protein [Pseudomonas cichorii]MBI6854784.1 hypothetical protein [Pseudomonas cichorii]
MRFKVREGNDYTKLRDAPVSPDEARRALRHFIARSKQGRDIPEDLMAFILAGLERQLASDEGGWFRVEKKTSDQYLPAKAWYCLNFDPKFERGSRGLTTQKEQHAAIGLHLKQKQSTLFAQFTDIDRSAFKDRYSENPTGEMIREFAESGFMLPSDMLSAEDARIWNLAEARLFCELALDMTCEEAKKRAIQIVDVWNREHGKGKN